MIIARILCYKRVEGIADPWTETQVNWMHSHYIMRHTFFEHNTGISYAFRPQPCSPSMSSHSSAIFSVYLVLLQCQTSCGSRRVPELKFKFKSCRPVTCSFFVQLGSVFCIFWCGLYGYLGIILYNDEPLSLVYICIHCISLRLNTMHNLRI